MEKSTVALLGQGLRQEFKAPENLPFPLRKALEALAKLPAELDEESPAESAPTSANSCPPGPPG